jgi:glycosyltransferase involved in cell wall biosynthesis
MLARALVDGGYQVTVCVYYEFAAQTIATVEAAGARVIALGLDRIESGGGGRGRRRRAALTARLAAALARTIRHERPSVVHLQYMTPGIVPLLVARAAGVPRVLATIHVTASHYGRRAWLPRAARQLCDVFLCVSTVAERSFFGSARVFCPKAYAAGRRHFTIYNGVDLRAIDRVLAAADTDGADDSCVSRPVRRCRPLVGIVGRLEHVKGHDLLLQAMAVVRRGRHVNAALLFVGDGSSREDLESQAAALGLVEHIEFTGRQPQAEAWRRAARADVIAMPSRPGLEGFGLSVAEAMAMRKAVIASNTDGLCEVVGSGGAAGILVPPCDIEALAGSIDVLLASPQRRCALGAAGRQRIEEFFSLDRFADQHLSLYRTVCGPRPKSLALPPASPLVAPFRQSVVALAS